MIPVSALSSFTYCSRKLYIESVLKIVSENKTAMTRGSLHHSCLEAFTNAEPGLLSEISSSTAYEDAQRLFVKRAEHISVTHIDAWEPVLEGAGLDKKSMTFEVMESLRYAARKRVREIFSFIEQEGFPLSGLNVDTVEPRLTSEQRLSSGKHLLKGVIDCVLTFRDGRLIPVEYKTGKAPNGGGVWPGHAVQVAAYALIVEDIFGVSVPFGILRYIDAQRDERVHLNPALRDEVGTLVRQVRKIFASSVLPPRCSNDRKCASCALREKCYDDAFMADRLELAKVAAADGETLATIKLGN